MNPSYPVFIDICLTKPRASDNIWLRYVTRIPYVPRNGDVLRLTSDDEESTIDITFVNVVFDASSGTFIEQQEDDAMVDSYSEEGLCHEADALGKYTAFGFHRLNYPQGEAR